MSGSMIEGVSAKCFLQLRQLRRIRSSLDDDPVNTLVHAFVTSRIDYCYSLLIGVPKKTTDKLQRVLNAVVRIISNTRKYDGGLRHFRRNPLHCFDVVHRVWFRLCVQVYRCLHSMAHGYLSGCQLHADPYLVFLDAGICTLLLQAKMKVGTIYWPTPYLSCLCVRSQKVTDKFEESYVQGYT